MHWWTARTRPAFCRWNLARLGAAYYTANLHKSYCAPKGAAFLWVRDDKQGEIRRPSSAMAITPPAGLLCLSGPL